MRRNRLFEEQDRKLFLSSYYAAVLYVYYYDRKISPFTMNINNFLDILSEDFRYRVMSFDEKPKFDSIVALRASVASLKARKLSENSETSEMLKKIFVLDISKISRFLTIRFYRDKKNQFIEALKVLIKLHLFRDIFELIDNKSLEYFESKIDTSRNSAAHRVSSLNVARQSPISDKPIEKKKKVRRGRAIVGNERKPGHTREALSHQSTENFSNQISIENNDSPVIQIQIVIESDSFLEILKEVHARFFSSITFDKDVILKMIGCALNKETEDLEPLFSKGGLNKDGIINSVDTYLKRLYSQ